VSAATLLADLVRCLHEESDALAAGDAQRVGALASRKQGLVLQLAPQLRAALSASDRTQLRRARHLNERNAQLLAVQLHSTRARGEALLQAQRGEALYDPDGLRAAGSRRTLAPTAA